jgi:hypothetical protein
MDIGTVYQKYIKQDGWVIGKGPSLRYLQAKYIGAGPVITLNAAILVVQELGLANPIYSMQKDGCGEAKDPRRCKGVCELKPPMVQPRDDIPVILQHPAYSGDCMPEHPARIFVNPVWDLNFDRFDTMSIRMAAAILRMMGCVKINFLCCDSLHGDYRAYDVETQRATMTPASVNYPASVMDLLEDLVDFPFEIMEVDHDE